MATQSLSNLGPALSMLDIADIPLGLSALDSLAKEAEVDVALSGTIHCGHYLILFGGEVEPVERSLRKATDAAAACIADWVLLPHAEPRIAPAIVDGGVCWPAPGDTLGVVQTLTPPTLLAAIDAALKGAAVELIELRTGDGLGGRAVAGLWGETHDVEAAIGYAEEAIAKGNAQSSSTTVIRNADPTVRRALSAQSTFFPEWRG